MTRPSHSPIVARWNGPGLLTDSDSDVTELHPGGEFHTTAKRIHELQAQGLHVERVKPAKPAATNAAQEPTA